MNTLTNLSNREEGGLCARCHHVRHIHTKRGSIFYLCLRSSTEPHFAKYPKVPVQQCCGYEAKTKDN